MKNNDLREDKPIFWLDNSMEFLQAYMIQHTVGNIIPSLRLEKAFSISRDLSLRPDLTHNIDTLPFDSIRIYRLLGMAP